MRDRLFAWLMRRASAHHEPMIAARKTALLGSLSGDILEIGPGTGVNLKYLDRSVRWTAFEPNRSLAAGIDVPTGGRLIQGPYRPGLGPYDAAISTLVLCSVADPQEVLCNIFRELRPGGRLVFIEHVAATPGSALSRQQDRWLPLWKLFTCGCHPNRQPLRFLNRAGFKTMSIDHFELPVWLASPHVAGIAVKP